MEIAVVGRDPDAEELAMRGRITLLAVLSGSVAEAVKESGMTESALAEFLEEEKHQMRKERRQR